MILRDTDMQIFYNHAAEKGIACVGIGVDFHGMLDNFSEFDWDSAICILADNDGKKQGKEERIYDKKQRIQSVDNAIKRIAAERMAILVTCSYYYEIFQQLNQMEELKNIECYIYSFMLNKPYGEPLCWKNSGSYKIPAKIHYCWFGGGKMPDLYKRCIDSWHRYCPDYEVIEWNETNCNIEENLYAKQAYEKKMYGFVPDYFRLKIIYEQGGIYLDTDVELVRSLDILRQDDAFCGLELPGEVALGLGFGAVVGHPVIGEMMHEYDRLRFVDENGKVNDTASPIYQTDFLLKKGFQYGNRKSKVLGMTIYPTWVLSPINVLTHQMDIGNETIAIHHFDGSWVSGERLAKKEKRLREAKELYELIENGNE